MKARKYAALGALAAAFAIPSAADAATVSYDADGTLRITAAAGEDNGLNLGKNDDGTLYISDYTWAPLSGAEDRCDHLYGNDYYYACEWPTRVVVDLGDVDDQYSGSEAVTVPVHVDGGAGDDQLQAGGGESLAGGAGNDIVKGWKGADTLDGGPGNDEVEGHGGADTVQGGDGDDLLSGDGYNTGTSADVIDGGPGKDKINWDWSDGGPAELPLAITLGGGADDGRAGEGDDLRNIEVVDLSSRRGVFTGSEGADEIAMHQDIEGSTIDGRGGNDRLLGADGPDTVLGGAGADYLDGGFGDDKITGGPGVDRVFGDRAGGDCGPLWCKYPYGNDTIDVRDGEVDQVTCGAGDDVVMADASDTVGADCEVVQRTGGATPPPPQQGGDMPGGASGGDTGGSSLTAQIGSIRLSKALKKGLPVRYTVSGAGTVKVTVKRGRKVVATGSAKPKRAGTFSGKAKFSKAGVKALKRSKKAALTVVVEFKPADGGEKRRATLKKTLR